MDFTDHFKSALTLEDDMLELISLKHNEEETLRDFEKRYHRTMLELVQSSASFEGIERKSEDRQIIV